jgi:hypothetical protein
MLRATGIRPRSPARPPGGLTGLERGLDGGRDELRCLRIDDDVPAQQHAADDLPGVRERAGRVDGAGGGTGGSWLGHNPDCKRTVLARLLDTPGMETKLAPSYACSVLWRYGTESYFRKTEVRPILLSIAARDICQPADSK